MILTRRALNRALLARQMLLARQHLSPVEATGHLVGMQAQQPQAPYLGLWSRLHHFHPEQASALLADRATVRTPLMRSTIHLVSATDAAALWPLTSTVLARTFRGSFATALGGVDVDELVARGADLIAHTPRTRAQLGPLLTQRAPDADPSALAHAVTLLTPVVQVPPRGLWRHSGPARWTTMQSWLGNEPIGKASTSQLVLRYLTAFGPATIRDIQTWSGLTRLHGVVDGLADRLRTFHTEDGATLYDVSDTPLPDPDTPAPVRFLPPFDNALLAHADRSRIIPPEHHHLIYRDRFMRTFLIDGFVAGTWRPSRGTLELRPFQPLPAAHREALVDEANRALPIINPSGHHTNVQVID